MSGQVLWKGEKSGQGFWERESREELGKENALANWNFDDMKASVMKDGVRGSRRGEREDDGVQGPEMRSWRGGAEEDGIRGAERRG
jgi:hypothetical protein